MVSALLDVFVGLLLAIVVLATDPVLNLRDDAGPRPLPYEVAPCRKGTIIECGIFKVPLDWHEPSVGNGSIVFARYPAANQTARKGTVFLHTGVSSWFSPDRAPQVDLGRQAGALYTRLNGEYDLVMWIPRGRGVPGISIPGMLSCFADSVDKSDYYQDMTERWSESPPGWDGATFEWTRQQTVDDALLFHQIQERVVISCLETADDQGQGGMLRYVGTAATVRDLVAMADAFDGPDAPIRFWGAQPGSLVGSYLQKLFPERAGRLVMDDPIDPIAYNAVPSYLTWQTAIAIANNTVATLEESCASDELADCSFPSGPPRPDMEFLGLSVRLLRQDLMGWRNQPFLDLLNSRYHQFYDAVRKDEKDTQNWQTFEEHTERLNRYPVHDPAALGLGDMPIICGDALDEHSDNKTLLAAVETVLTESLHSVPLLMPSAFPSWRFLCHLWPIRAIERISFSEPQEQKPVQETLVLLRKLDPWNYPRVSDSAARELWPDAHVFSDLEFGQYMFDHNNCNLDLIANFLANGTVPEEAFPCQDGDERRHPSQIPHTRHRRAH
ncbi:hypothetical protein K466DRAFT_551213 [Polyporus arcularius HHB13444]|uniref:Peptidase S33 tripeptidyl aminopeptidase-like C-terminal domain-containing protein n=1 Tax=Polyporus arcularius HHB13444 TaxID=1314778 RepID=A0A5C3PBH9_9APHY|nr:hypothetical protein K466DRAFT_551213 [Polyporus arcularius HHB13444]